MVLMKPKDPESLEDEDPVLGDECSRSTFVDSQDGRASQSRMDHSKGLKQAMVAVTEKCPQKAEPFFHLGLLSYRLGQPEEAKEAFEKALQCLPSRPGMDQAQNEMKARLHNHIAQCSLSSQFTSGGVVTTKQIQEKFMLATQLDFRQPDIWNNMGLLYSSIEKHDKARLVLDGVISKVPDYFDALNNLGLAHLALEQYEAAEKCFQVVIYNEKQHIEALSNYGLMLLQQRQYQHAITCLEYTARVDATQAYVWNNLGCAYMGLNRYEEANTAFQEALSLNPDDVHIQYNIATLLSLTVSSSAPADQASRALMAREGLERILHSAAFPDAWLSLGQLLRILMETGKDDGVIRKYAEQAKSALSMVLDEDPEDPVVWLQLGLLAYAEGDYDLAQKHFAQSVSYNLKCPASLSNLGVVTQILYDEENAKKFYEAALQVSPSSHYVYNNLGNLHRQQGRFKEAEQAYRKCLELNPDYAIAYNNFALLALVQDDVKSAREMFEQALRLDPNLECARSNILMLDILERRQSQGQIQGLGGKGRSKRRKGK